MTDFSLRFYNSIFFIEHFNATKQWVENVSTQTLFQSEMAHENFK